MTLKVWFLHFFALVDQFVKVQLGRYQNNISQEWSRVKNLKFVSCAAWNVFPVNLLLLRSLFRARKSKCNFLKANLLYIFDARRPWPWFLGVLSTTLGLNAFRKEDCYFHQTFTWTAIKFRYCEKKYHTVFLNYLKVRKSQKRFFLKFHCPKSIWNFWRIFSLASKMGKIKRNKHILLY